jgi:FixJ family two-component response regulator
VVEDDSATRRVLARIVTRYRVARFASTVDEAYEQIASRTDWCGFMIDLGLGPHEHAGFEVLQRVRERFPDVPAALVTGRIEVDVVNRAATLNCAVLGKPVGEAELGSFLRRVVARDHEFANPLAARLEAVASAWKLSPREYEIVAWLVAGGTRDAYLTRTGMADTTFRTHMKHIFRKAKASSFTELLSLALRRMFTPDELPFARAARTDDVRADETASGPEGASGER